MFVTLTPEVHAAHLAAAIATNDLNLALTAAAELREWSHIRADAVDLAPLRKAEPRANATPPGARKSHPG